MKETSAYNIRCNYLDWLRVFAVILAFFYHSLHFFDAGDWSVKNPTLHAWIEPFILNFLAVWMMPLIFLVSGASVYYAAGKSNAINFIKDKIMRLLVPLIVGVFSFSIMQVYLERVSHGQFLGSFFDFIPHYFNGLYVPGGSGNFAFHGMHLWYLLFLFTFTLVLFPLFWWLKGNLGSLVLKKAGSFLSMPGFFIVLALPTVLIQNLVMKRGILVVGGWDIIQYIWFFFAGYLISSNQKLQLQIMKSSWIWVSLLLAYLFCSTFFLHKGLDYHAEILVWLELFAMLGISMKYFDFSNAFLKLSSEAVMPFYILHQNILLLVGYFVVLWKISDLIKYILIVISTLAIIAIFYEYFIRRYNPVRLLFGMKPLK